MLEASTVVHLTRALVGSNADWCVVGGWGVDALFGEETRLHKDLMGVFLFAAKESGVVA